MELRERYAQVHALLSAVADKAVCEQEEYIKTISSLYSQLERVKDYLDGKSAGKFFSNITEDAQARSYLDQIEKYAGMLRSGQYPFAGRFIENGATVIDHCLIKKDELYHLFYIRGKAGFNWSESPTNEFGHAVSADLKKWIALPPVVRSSEGAFDSYQVWAPHIVQKDGKYYMFYTGVNENAAQTVGVAVSEDLYLWDKYEGNPLLHTEQWKYWGASHWSNGRDPMVLEDGGIYYMYYTRSRMVGEDLQECIGVSSSSDLLHWKDEGTIGVEDSVHLPPESPFAVKHGGKYYLFYSQYYVGTCCLVSDSPTKGFCKTDCFVVDKNISASEVFEEDGKYYLTRITHEPNDVHLFDMRELEFSDGGVCLKGTEKE